MFRRWRRLDEPGLELLHLVQEQDSIFVSSTLVHAGAEPFGVRYMWMLDSDWRTKSLRLELSSERKDQALLIERMGETSWRIDGQPRPDLDGCVEVDVSATPFCNGLAIRRLGNQTREMTALYVALPELTVEPSLQRYEFHSPGRWRYVDLGAAKGFTAMLDLDADGLVAHYEGLFEAIEA
jgi:uncharacterized protein